MYFCFLTNSAEIGGLCLNFQQGNAPIHIEKAAVKWFLYNGVHIINTFFRLKLHEKLMRNTGKSCIFIVGNKNIHTTSKLKQDILYQRHIVTLQHFHWINWILERRYERILKKGRNNVYRNKFFISLCRFIILLR